MGKMQAAMGRRVEELLLTVGGLEREELSLSVSERDRAASL